MNREMLDSEGFIVVDINEGRELSDMVHEFLQTETGQDYKANYYTKERSDADLGAAIELAQKKAKREQISVNELTKAFAKLMAINAIPRRGESSWVKLTTPPAPPEPVVEIDKNGRPLTPAQLQWREYRQWSDEHSVEECRQRARSDALFGTYWRNQAEQQFAATAPGDAVVPVGEPEKHTRAGVALSTFAQQYLKASTASLKPINGLVHLGDEAVPVETFNALLVRARNTGLI